MVQRVFLIGLLAGGLLAGAAPVSAQKVKSAPFSYLPEPGTDRYDMRVPNKTRALANGAGFVVLAHQSAGGYTVERYDADLKKQCVLFANLVNSLINFQEHSNQHQHFQELMKSCKFEE